MNKKIIIIIFSLSIFFSFTINELNLYSLKSNSSIKPKENTKSLVNNSTIWSIDNSWYLPYAENISKGYGYTLDPNEPEMKVRRTPVYPLFYGVHFWIFGKESSFFFIRFTQVLLYALSAILLTLSVYNITKNKTWSMLTGLLYATSPFIASYNYYTITEAISPSLVSFSIYYFSLFIKNKKLPHLFLTGIMIGLSFLNRPTTGLLLPSFGFVLLVINFKLKPILIKGIIISLGFIVIVTPWAIRNYIVTEGNFIVAEKIYHNTPMNFGKAHIELRSLLSTVMNPANLSTESLSSSLKTAELNSNKSNELIHNYIDKWPSKFFKICTKNELHNVINLLHIGLIDKENEKSRKPTIKRSELFNLKSEQIAYNSINSLKNKYISAAPIDYHIITPLILVKEMMFNSNSSSIGSLNPINGKLSLTQIVSKSIMYVLNALLFISLFSFAFYQQKIIKSIILLFPLLTIAFFIFVFRNYEMRYFLPIYPFLYISLGFLTTYILDKIKIKLL